MKFLVHGDVFGWITPTRDVPTLKTPYGDFPEWMREFVLHKLDVRKKWMGCWMYREGLTRDQKTGEPLFKFKDPKRVAGLQWQWKPVLYKNRIAMEFVDFAKVPRRPNGVPDWNVLHLCGNVDCLNPSHLMICLDHHEHRNKDELRDTYLVPGQYYVG